MSNTQKKLDNTITGTRSNHNMSFNWLGSADFGRIVPFHVQELIGTDKVVTCKPQIEMQMLPLASPTFGKISLYIHYYFVPTRLLWKDFLDFYSQTGENKDSEPPYWTPNDFWLADFVTDNPPENFDETFRYNERSLYKHWTSFGLPPFWKYTSVDPTLNGRAGLNNDDKISLLPFRAYNQVWWDFYRDTELIPDSNKSLYLHTFGGHEDMEDPTSGANPRSKSNVYVPRLRSLKDVWFAELFAKNGISPIQTYLGDRSLQNSNIITSEDGLHSIQHRKIEALTRLAERLSLSGKRQIDMLFTQYGIKPEFSKLQMSQYLGGAKQTVLVSDITSSANTTGFDGLGSTELGVTGSPLGAKAGSGYCTFDELNINFTAQEPGYLLGVFSVMPEVHFVQGLGKEWFRNIPNDWFRKDLEHVGQVAVPKKEIGVNYFGFGDSASDNMRPNYDIDENDKTFAFTQPYYEYKRKMDVLAGDFMYYHMKDSIDNDSNDIAYMQSMGLYVDFANDRDFNAENLQTPSFDANKVFYYQGGSIWDNVDDHFHLNIDVNCVLNRPMDGYAIPTLETTENPHASKQVIGNSSQL